MGKFVKEIEKEFLKMKLGLTTNQWDLLWWMVGNVGMSVVDRESVRGWGGFTDKTINSLINRGLVGSVFYANGEHLNITDMGSEFLQMFADSALKEL